MHKSAFIPTVLFPIKSREDYESKIGRGKRELNEAIGAAIGAVAGGGAGYGVGHITGKMIDKKYPNKLVVSTRVFEHMGDKSKYNPVSKYIRGYRKYVGKTPRTIPYVAYAPVVMGIYGALGGMLSSEYKTIKKMEQQAGINPQTTSKDYLKREVFPAVAGVSTGMIVADAIGSILRKTNINKLTTARKSLSVVPAVGVGAGAGMLMERIIEKNMKGQNARKDIEKSAYFRLGQIIPKTKAYEPMRNAAAGMYRSMRKTPMGADVARIMYDKVEILPHHLITAPIPVYPTTLMDGVLALAEKKTRPAKIRTLKSIANRAMGKGRGAIKGMSPDMEKVTQYANSFSQRMFDHAPSLGNGVENIIIQQIR